ncbi:putative nucleotidyltransferase substrate binding domain-containing protein [Amaricoccus sp.]|uniref:putative nucleotidyltransferase substrate binding domain-containing protein n=1 Tax=Amaricoccus sp. TaxID=1872485 RepID=UPI0026189F6C|nr:putative nucleotidyltransferase substrate binding domain-containing protein [Amaricoccus sp.]HRO10231.1 putative nucleotidyltransferase substrate binding domain-containing protein [Amaricoccus sp.]
MPDRLPDTPVGSPQGRADAEHRERREFVSLMAARVRDAALRKPYFVDAGTDLVTLCRDLAARGIADALVRDGDRLGIFTTTNLREALIADRPPAALLVREFTAFAPFAVAADDPLYDALILMLRHRIHRVLVREGEEVVGILSQLDLMGFLASHSHLIAHQAARAVSVEELGAAARQIDALIRVLSEDGVRVEVIAGIVNSLNRQIFRRLWELVAPAELRAASCLIVMGSEGRGEQIIKTDQDNALILKDGFAFEGLEAVTEAFTAALIEFGYPPCPGGIMLSRPLWRQPLEGFRAALRDWTHGSDPEGPMNLAIFLDAAAVAGDAGLLAELRAYLRRLLAGSDAFYARFAAAIEQFGAEGGWWRRLPGLRGREAAEIDLKKLGIFPLVHGVRTLALQYGVEALGTEDRLRALAAAGRIEAGRARDLTDALHLLMGLKLSSNLRQIEAGRAPDNAIRLAELGTLEQQALKDSLTIVRDFRQWLALHFRLDAL